MAKFETIPLVELKTRLPAKLLPLVEEYKERLDKLTADQGGRLDSTAISQFTVSSCTTPDRRSSLAVRSLTRMSLLSDLPTQVK